VEVSPAKGGTEGGARPRGRLDRNTIVSAGIALADSEGLDAVSVRRLATELGARPMSLYDHFESKDNLLAAMADEIVGEALVEGPLPDAWRPALETIARQTYALMVAHPWLVSVFTRPASSFGANSAKHAEQFTQALAGLQLQPEEAWLIAGTLNDYLLGHSLRVGADRSATRLAKALEESEVAKRPEFTALSRSLRSRASAERFEWGLAVVLDGVEAALRQRDQVGGKG